MLVIWEIVVYIAAFIAAIFIITVAIALAVPALGDHVWPWVQNAVFPAIAELVER